MGFTDKLTDTIHSISSAAAYADDGDTTTDATAASQASGSATTGTDDSTSSTSTAPPDDGVDSDPAGDDLQTSDTTLGKATKAIAEGSKKAWELTADAQRRANDAGKSWGQKAAERNGLWNPELAGGEATGHGEHHSNLGHDTAVARESIVGVAEAFEAIHLASESPLWKYADPSKIVNSAPVGVLEKVGKGVTVLGMGANVREVFNDITDSDGLSVDSLKPVADFAVGAASLIASENWAVKWFSAWYAAGSIIDHYTGISDVGYSLADSKIARTTQIGFLTDRAKENDLTVAYRTENGTWTDRDIVRSRSIVREAREHGLVDEDGNVDRLRLRWMLPASEAYNAERIAGGIERAVELQKTAHDRYY